MLYVVTGGSGSGKSEYAEKAAVKVFEDLKKRRADEARQADGAPYAGCRLQAGDVQPAGSIPQTCAVCCTEDGNNSVTDAGLESGHLYYVATMQPYDEECRERIARHQRMRSGKGFLTLECPCRVGQLKGEGQDVFLLEDLSNLLSNEQYLEEGRIKGDAEKAYRQAEDAILAPLLRLAEQAGCVIVVTNEIFSDGIRYPEETENFCRLLGFLNRELAKRADGVAEVVCSIPLCQKGELPC